jgi:hypothetical protein
LLAVRQQLGVQGIEHAAIDAAQLYRSELWQHVEP